MQRKSIVRVVIWHVVGLVLAYVYTQVAWAAGAGVVMIHRLRGDEALQRRAAEMLEEAGFALEPGQSPFENLSPEFLKTIERIAVEVIKDADWLVVGLVVSALVFAPVGLFTGRTSRSWAFIGVLPALCLLWNNPLLWHARAGTLTWPGAICIVVVGQFGVAYLFAYFGARLARRRDRKRALAAQGK